MDVFKGDSGKYPQWREQFRLFVEETGVPPHVKMLLLEKCLKGRPLQMVSNFDTPAVSTAWLNSV